MSDRETMLAALEGMSSRARRSSLDAKLPEGKRGGLTIIVVAPKGDESDEVEPTDPALDALEDAGETEDDEM